MVIIPYEVLWTEIGIENEIDLIFENSLAMGLEEIILEQKEKEGKRKGKQEGKREEKIQVAYNCWKEGSSAEFTAKITELPVEQILELFDRFSSVQE